MPDQTPPDPIVTPRRGQSMDMPPGNRDLMYAILGIIVRAARYALMRLLK